MSNNFVSERTDLMVTTRCTLKCKLCSFAVPYIKKPAHCTVENLSRQLEKFFEVWYSTKRLNFVGGEVFTHPKFYEILQEALKYKDKVKAFRITTNGTILPSEKIFKLIVNHNTGGSQFEIVISDYGPSLSQSG